MEAAMLSSNGKAKRLAVMMGAAVLGITLAGTISDTWPDSDGSTVAPPP